MRKTFNTDGYCDPELNYMVDLTSRLGDVKKMVDDEKYFTVNRARQYGKTTLLTALADYLKEDYSVISLDFQTISNADFESEQSFVAAFSREILDTACPIPDPVREKLAYYSTGTVRQATLSVLFKTLLQLCAHSEKRVVMIIDEVDTASNNQVFIDFLAQLRAYYLKRRKIRTFQSVILAGVYDVRNIRRKIRPEEEHRQNSPWNTRAGNEENESSLSFDDCPRDHKELVPYDIASDFDVNMSFSPKDIAGMIGEYESDHHTGMDIEEVAGLLYDCTSGYPFLVSRLCKIMDEKLTGTEMFKNPKDVWTRAGVSEAEKILLSEKNTLFESLIGKLNDYPELKELIFRLLFEGQTITYNADDPSIDMLLMFGFIKTEHALVQIANRIFETRLYNYFLTLPEVQSGEMYRLALCNKTQFIQNGRLNMKLILEKFVIHFDDIYGDRDERFLEEDGRRYFMLYMKPIINGAGNYYVESRTRNQERTDLIIDYLGQQFVIEMKVWRGNAYNERGEEQLKNYLDYYHLDTGYMLSFNFNKKKEPGIKELKLGEKTLIEAVV